MSWRLPRCWLLEVDIFVVYGPRWWEVLSGTQSHDNDGLPHEPNVMQPKLERTTLVH